MPKAKEILKRPVSIIIISSILVFFSNVPAFILLHKGLFTQDSLLFSLVISLSAFIIMFVLPVLIIKFIFKEKLENFGLFLPKQFGQSSKLIAISLLIFLPIIFFLGSFSNFQQYYLIKQNLGGLFFLEVAASCLYFFSEEFIFRGFLFFGLWNKLGFHTFWVSSLIFALFHLGKPSGEVFFAFFAGLALSFLSYKTKSFIPAAVVHSILAFILNVIIFFHVVL